MSEHDPDGLDHYRRRMYATIVLLPTLLSGLPFVGTGYHFSGAFCNLPLRPIWYRLALAWGPRFLVAAIITIATIHMYVYVDFKFKGFSRTSVDLSLSPRSIPRTNPSPKLTRRSTLSGRKITSRFDWRRPSSIATFKNATPPSKASTPMQPHSSDPRPFDFAFPPPDSTEPLSPTVLVQPADDPRRPSVATTSSKVTFATEKSNTSLEPLEEMPSQEQEEASSPPVFNPGFLSPGQSPHRYLGSAPVEDAANHTLEAQRLLLQRQLRNNFIYPVIYLTTWTVPAITTCMQFSTKYANSTPGWLGVLGVFSLTSMGAIDSLAFLWKEKPWRTVPLGDSWLCFSLWKGKRRGEKRDSTASTSSVSPRHRESDIEMQGIPTATGGWMERPYLARTRSSDRQKLARQRALERLALEQQDRKTNAFAHELSAGASQRHVRREWWDLRRASSFGIGL